MRWKKAVYMLVELFLRFVVNPYLRAHLLRILGAKVGKKARVYEVCFFNLQNGFDNLSIGDDVHVGVGCRLDLEGKITIARGATISPGVTILTHCDPGSKHKSPICINYPPFVADVEIGEYCWIGVNSVLLAGSLIKPRAVVGACSLVKGTLDADQLYFGVPAKKVKTLSFN